MNFGEGGDIMTTKIKKYFSLDDDNGYDGEVLGRGNNDQIFGDAYLILETPSKKEFLKYAKESDDNARNSRLGLIGPFGKKARFRVGIYEVEGTPVNVIFGGGGEYLVLELSEDVKIYSHIYSEAMNVSIYCQNIERIEELD